MNKESPNPTFTSNSNEVNDFLEGNPTIKIPEKNKPNEQKQPSTHTQSNEMNEKDNIKPNPIKNTQRNNTKNNKMLYSNFDIKNIEYSIEKKLSYNNIDKNEPFMSRMEKDLKRRQLKTARRNKIISMKIPKKTEHERIKGFNRLIEDANRREIGKDNQLENTPKINPKTISPEEWEEIYQKRFLTYKNKYEEKLERKIIEKEKESKDKEDKIVDDINNRTKKVSKVVIHRIVNQLWEESKKREEKRKKLTMEIESNRKFLYQKEVYNKKKNYKPMSVKKNIEPYKSNRLCFEFSSRNINRKELSAKKKGTPWKQKPILCLNEMKGIEDELEIFNFQNRYPTTVSISYKTGDFSGFGGLKEDKYNKEVNKKQIKEKKYIPDHKANILVNNIISSKLNKEQ